MLPQVRFRPLVHLSTAGHDVAFQPDQSKPAVDLIRALLSRAKAGGKVRVVHRLLEVQAHHIPISVAQGKPAWLTPADISAFAAERRATSRAHNGQFTFSASHNLLSAADSSIMYNVFGGK